MTAQVAKCWFRYAPVDDGIVRIWEHSVDPILRCNMWYVRGHSRGLLVDTGLGIMRLREAVRTLLCEPLVAVATHSHIDHVGGMFEFEERLIHPSEAGRLAEGSGILSLRPRDRGPAYVESLRRAGYSVPEEYLSEYPYDGYDVARFAVRPAPATHLVQEGDVIDLGDRRVEVLHLPGHTPGSIALWEAATGILFSGDVIYDGPLLDDLPGANIPDYVESMRRLLDLPVRVVHGGHESSFGRERLVEIARNYIGRRT